jgi:hypothetical protein
MENYDAMGVENAGTLYFTGFPPCEAMNSLTVIPDMHAQSRYEVNDE